MKFAFSADRKKRFNALLKRYPDKRSVTLPALHLAQEQEGFLNAEIIKYLAGILEIKTAELMDTVSFYTMFRTKSQGKYLLQVCQTLSCSLLGADELVDYLATKHKIRVGETTEDGLFTLLKVECLGSCGTAPVLQVNEDYIEKATHEKVDRVLRKLT